MFEELEAVSKRLKKFERLEKEIENSRDVWKKSKVYERFGCAI